MNDKKIKWYNQSLSVKSKKIWFATNYPQSKKDHKKPILLFLNGLCCSELHFKEQISFFHEQDYPLVIYHYRNHFKSSHFDQENFNLESIASDTAKLIKKIQSNRIVIIAHSMGANIATMLEANDLYNDIAECVQKFIFISGPASQVSDSMFNSNLIDLIVPGLKKIEPLKEIAQKILWRHLESIPTVALTRFLGFNSQLVSHNYVKSYLHDVACIDPNIFIKLFQEICTVNMTPLLAVIDKPILFIVGDHDLITPVAQFLMFRKLKNNEVFIVKGGSHVPQIEFPEIINSKILSFL